MAFKARAWKKGLVITVSIVVALIVLLIGPSWSRLVYPIPEVASNLTSSFDERSRSFNERIQQRYPKGSSVAAMVSELRAQGFDIHAETANGGDWAAYETYDWICSSRWYVSWRRGLQGDLIDVKASFGTSCL